MAQVLVRDVDPAIVDKLKTRAQRNHRSLEAELRLILTEAVEVGERNRLEEVDRVRALFAGRQFSDSADLLREDRDR